MLHQPLTPDLYDLCVHAHLQVTLNVAKRLVYDIGAARGRHERPLGTLQRVLVAAFANCDVGRTAKSVPNTFQPLAFVFQ